MRKIYEVYANRGVVEFKPWLGEFPAQVFEKAVNPADTPAVLEVHCRLGDPELLHCVVWRQREQPGGYFALHDSAGLLYAAVAHTNLDYAAALGYFGAMTSNARYGADIFEELGENDV